MSPERFHDLTAQLHAASTQIQGAALISMDGAILYQEGEIVADAGLIGIAGAAVMRLAEHIGSGLAECPAQEITIRCEKHAALFMPMGPNILLMVVLSADADTRALAQPIMAFVQPQGAC
ncbi:MAG: roadblock/LC7 domain-containing protein [Acidithiobacillus sp.]